ncbi:MAG TPA: hypothetical protein VF340_01780 [Methyloceanibacter sp.]|jgi:hypothetical protein
MLVRYAMLLAMAGSAVWGLVVVSNSDGGRMLLADVGQGDSGGTSFWLLACIATLITLSLFRFVVFGLPSMLDQWYGDKRSWIYAFMIGGALYGMFYLAEARP